MNTKRILNRELIPEGNKEKKGKGEIKTKGKNKKGKNKKGKNGTNGKKKKQMGEIKPKGKETKGKGRRKRKES